MATTNGRLVPIDGLRVIRRTHAKRGYPVGTIVGWGRLRQDGRQHITVKWDSDGHGEPFDRWHVTTSWVYSDALVASAEEASHD